MKFLYLCYFFKFLLNFGIESSPELRNGIYLTVQLITQHDNFVSRTVPPTLELHTQAQIFWPSISAHWHGCAQVYDMRVA